MIMKDLYLLRKCHSSSGRQTNSSSLLKIEGPIFSDDREKIYVPYKEVHLLQVDEPVDFPQADKTVDPLPSR